MKKLMALVVVSALYGGEIDFGSGTFTLKGGFSGLESQKSTDVTSYTLAEEHKNLFGSKWFYKYEISYFQSKDIKTATTDLNSISSRAITDDLTTLDTTDTTQNDTATQTTDDTTTTQTTPTTQTLSNPTTYKYEALDINLAIGKDLLHKDEQNYLGVGLLVGLSIPYIDTNSDSNDDTTETVLKKTKTKIMTYKVGPVITLRKNFNKKIGLYSTLTYAYQTGSVKNDELDVDTTADGNFMQYGIGIRYTPFMTKYKTKWITFTPKLYFTLGYRYSYWDLKDVDLNVAGLTTTQKTDLEMGISVVYAGIGYSF